MPRYRAFTGKEELGPWRPTKEHALQDAVEADHGSRDPWSAYVSLGPLVVVIEEDEPLSISTEEKRWAEAIALMQRYQDGTMRFLDDMRRTSRDDAVAHADWRAMEREVSAISERKQRRQAERGTSD